MDAGAECYNQPNPCIKMLREIFSYFKKNKVKALLAIGAALSPIAVPFITYNFYLGYCSYFGIPKFFISLGQVETIEAIVFVLVFLLISTLVYLPLFYLLQAILNTLIMNPLKGLIKKLAGKWFSRLVHELKIRFKSLLDLGFVFITIFYLLYLFLLGQSFPQEIGSYVAKGQSTFPLITDNSETYLVLMSQDNNLVVSEINLTNHQISNNYKVINKDKAGLLFSHVDVHALKSK